MRRLIDSVAEDSSLPWSESSITQKDNLTNRHE